MPLTRPVAAGLHGATAAGPAELDRITPRRPGRGCPRPPTILGAPFLSGPSLLVCSLGSFPFVPPFISHVPLYSFIPYVPLYLALSIYLCFSLFLAQSVSQSVSLSVNWPRVCLPSRVHSSIRPPIWLSSSVSYGGPTLRACPSFLWSIADFKDLDASRPLFPCLYSQVFDIDASFSLSLSLSLSL